MSGTPHARHLLLVAVALVLATPVATWFGGDFIFSLESIEDPDHMIRPPHIDPVLQVGIGATAVVVAVASCAVLFIWSDRYDRRWWTVLGPLVAAGTVCGGGWAMITAPVIGANIGGGLAVMFGTPALLVLVVVAGVNSIRLRGGGGP